eukprot:jgi/Tetstr1/436708/TSEL_025491.t1
MRKRNGRGTIFANLVTEAQGKGSRPSGVASTSGVARHAMRTPEKQRGGGAVYASPKPLSKMARRAMYGGIDPDEVENSPTGSGQVIAKRLRVDQGREWPAAMVVNRSSADHDGNQTSPGGMIRRPSQTMTAYYHKHTSLRNHLGMANLGNTCYMNAVVQVLLGIRVFEAELQQGALSHLNTPRDGVLAALRDCLQARHKARKNARPDTSVPISLEELKSAMERYTHFCRGSMQQDAHEFFCVLLDRLQSEVLMAECAKAETDGAAQTGKAEPQRAVDLSKTADPVARNFEFSVYQILRCKQCNHKSRIMERFTHLSLELPANGSPGKCFDISSLLRAYMEDEEVSKSCEHCGTTCAPHSLTHQVARLPQYLALHLKRFQWAEREDGGLDLRKVNTRVKHQQQLSLSEWSSRSTRLPMSRTSRPNAVTEVLASGHADKENMHRGSELRRHGMLGLRARSVPNLAGMGQSMQRVGSGWNLMAGAALANKEAADLQRAMRLSNVEKEKEAKRRQEEADLQQALLASMVAAPADPAPMADEDPALRQALAASLEVPSPLGVPEVVKPPRVPIVVVDDDLAAGEHGAASAQAPAGQASMQRAGSQVIDLLAHQYKLCATISHKGEQADEGHFIADVLGSSGCWVRYDDSKVSTLSTSQLLPPCEARERECYLMFYSLQPEPIRLA